MTLDEAINNFTEAAKNHREEQQYWLNERDETSPLYEADRLSLADDSRESAEYYEQLAEWLQELRAFRKIRMCGNCRHYVYGTTHFGECHVTSDIEPCVVGINQTACDTFFDYKDFRSCRQFAEWLTELREAKSIIRVCNRVLGYLLECEIESTSTRHEVETLLKSITEYLSGGSENG